MQLNREIFQKLKENVIFFKNFNDVEMLGLLKSTQREVFKDKDIVFKEGTRGDKLYIIIAGSVRISRSIGKNQEEVLAELGNGVLFGEMGPINQSPRSARATAMGNTVLLSLREAALRHNNLALAYKLYRNFAQMLADRLRITNEKLSSLSISDRDANEKIRQLVKNRLENNQDLKGADLRYANLSEAFLHNTDLSHSLFMDANLQEAKMRNANLQGSKFINAKFTETDLSGSNFSGADFSGASFTDANLSDAKFVNCTFSGADLGQTRQGTNLPLRKTS